MIIIRKQIYYLLNIFSPKEQAYRMALPYKKLQKF